MSLVSRVLIALLRLVVMEVMLRAPQGFLSMVRMPAAVAVVATTVEVAAARAAGEAPAVVPTIRAPAAAALAAVLM
jgi:hypothetical protein